MLRLDDMKRAYERLTFNPSCRGISQCTGDTNTIGCSPRTEVAVVLIETEAGMHNRGGDKCF